jgi:RNA polymerase sigma-70 factor (ECF subfamily)
VESVDRADTRGDDGDVAARARFERSVRELVDPLRRFLARRTDAATADDVLADTL